MYAIAGQWLAFVARFRRTIDKTIYNGVGSSASNTENAELQVQQFATWNEAEPSRIFRVLSMDTLAKHVLRLIE